jgi:predicted Zn-dependent protease
MASAKSSPPGPYLLVKTFVRSESGLAACGRQLALLVRQSFSQKYELEADAVGWDYLVRAGLDPRALPRMLQKLQQAQDSRGPDLQWKAFSSHPETEKRIRRLEEKWRQLQKQGWQPRPMP